MSLPTRLARAVRLATVGLASTGLVLSVGLSPTTASASEEGERWFASEAGDAYEYPLDPVEDAAVWASYSTSDLMELLKVPESVLEPMSTSGLLETVLTFPFMPHYSAFDFPQDGIDSVRQSSNALDEFVQRPDAGSALLDLYVRADLAQIALTEEYPITQVRFIELLLAQPPILDSLGAEGRAALVQEIMNKWSAKQEMAATQYYREDSALLVLMHALETDSEVFAAYTGQEETLGSFVDDGLFAGFPLTDWNVFWGSMADTYGVTPGSLQQAPLVRYGSGVSGYVYTPRNTPVPLGPPPIVWPQEMAEWTLLRHNLHPDSSVVGPATVQYNCHWYAWASQDYPNQQRWMPDPSYYWEDGSYVAVATHGWSSADTVPSAVPVGARVYYSGGNHSAVVASSTQFVSKWGPWGLVRHNPTETPYLATQLIYYTPADGPPSPPPPPPPPPPASGVRGDFNGDGDVDLVGRLGVDATLWFYPGDGSGGFETPVQIGHGWSGFDALVSPGDFDGDDRSDLIGRMTDGTLWLYRGTGAGGFGAGEQIGQGWSDFTSIVGPGDFSGDGNADLIGRNTAGRLLLYRGDGSGGFYSGNTEIGHGWQGFTSIVAPGDFSGDGRPDLIARTSDGRLYLYRGNGSGGFNPGSTQIGNGWNIFDLIIAPGDFSGDGRNDLIGRKPDGTLWLYRGNGSGGFTSPYPQIGHGWAGFAAIV